MNKLDSDKVKPEKKVMLQELMENKAVKVAGFKLQKDFIARPSNLTNRSRS